MTERGRPRNFDRDAALREAMRLFWKFGYQGTSLSDLTRAMGITAPSLYCAFDNKESLFREAVEYYMAHEGSATSVALRQPDTYTAIERMLLSAAKVPDDADAPRGCLVVLGAINYTPGNDEVNQFMEACRQLRRNEIQQRLDAGVAKGDLPAATDTASLADFFTTVLQGMAIQARDGASEKKLTAIARNALRAWPA